MDVVLNHGPESNVGELLSVEQTLKTAAPADRTRPRKRRRNPSSTALFQDRGWNQTDILLLSVNDHDSHPVIRNGPAGYWNLSCPLEMSTFSAAHIGGDDFLERAYKARNLSTTALPLLKKNGAWLLSGRRIFFVGDSLLRQVFISLSCHYWNRVEEYAVPWFERRHGRTNHANTISHGPHSKFEEARVVLKGGSEFIFHHGIGGLLSLGQDYRSHDPNMWLEACMRGKPFTTMIIDMKFGPIISEQSVPRKSLELRTDDIVVVNGSVHGDRTLNLNNIADLVECMDRDPVKKETLWPRLVYLATGMEHFPTNSGKFEEQLTERNYTCQQEVPRDLTHEHRQREERTHVGRLLPILGQNVLDLEVGSGDLHVGGRDCLHWIMPGIPDLLAASLIAALGSKR